MNRRVAAVGILLIAVVFAIQALNRQLETPASGQIAELQKKRISFLERRVELIESRFAANQASGGDVTTAKIDMIDAQLDYASSDEQRRGLLSELLKQLDKQIEIAKLMIDPPIRPGREADETFDAASALLLLQAERIRVQIELERIK